MKPRLEDPVLKSARREAVVVFGVWLAACVYSVGYCFLFGYARDPMTLSYVAGVPDWIFYGVAAPWAVCTLLSFWISNYFITDEDLGEEQAEVDLNASEKGADHA